MQLDLDHKQLTTIRMALIAWIARCENEAKIMDTWALDESLDTEKCRRNAIASRAMKAEAEAVLSALP